MEQAEVDQEVTDLLLTALQFLPNYPPAAMLYCRQSIECIIHNKYFQEEGEKPTEDEQGNFPSLMAITKNVKKSLGKQTARVVGSINIQSRGSLHWDFDSRGRAAKSHHVKAVINQVVITHKDIFGSEIVLEGLRIDDETLEGTVKKTIDNLLSDQGITTDPNFQEKNVNVEEVGKILELADAALEKGIELDLEGRNRLGLAAINSGQYEVAQAYFHDALLRIRDTGVHKLEILSSTARYWLFWEATLLGNIGIVQNYRNEFTDALTMFHESIVIFKKLDEHTEEARILMNLGTVSHRAANWDVGNEEEQEGYLDTSLAFYEESLALYRKLGLVNDSVAMGLGNIGLITEKRGDYEGAEKQFRDSLVLAKFLQNKPNIVWAMNNLAWNLTQQNNFDESTALAKSALAICQEEGYRAHEAASFATLSSIAFRMEEFEEAERTSREYVRISNELGLPLRPWWVNHRFTDSDAPWDFPPK